MLMKCGIIYLVGDALINLDVHLLGYLELDRAQVIMLHLYLRFDLAIKYIHPVQPHQPLSFHFQVLELIKVHALLPEELTLLLDHLSRCQL